MTKIQNSIKEISKFYDEYLDKNSNNGYQDSYLDTVVPNVILRLLDVQSGISYYSHLLDCLKVSPKKRLLDIGCGFGALLRMVEVRGTLTWGIDISQKAVEVAHQCVKASKIILANVERLPFKNNLFDFITCVGTLEHIPNIDAAVREIATVCKDSGRILIVVPNVPIHEKIRNCFRKIKIKLQATDQLYEQVFVLPDWKKRLERNGLKVLRVYKDNHTWLRKRFFFNDYLRILRRVIRKMLPVYFSYQFIFICVKR